MTVSTSVTAMDGSVLSSNFTSSFTTELTNANYFYRLTNEVAGTTKALDRYAGSYGCFFGELAGYTGQCWNLVSVTSDFTR